MNKHTPGPWASIPGGNDIRLIVDSAGFKIAAVDLPFKCSAAMEQANANLLAAAPELLEELEEYSSHAKEIIEALLAAGGRDNLLLADKINRRHPIRFKLIARTRGQS